MPDLPPEIEQQLANMTSDEWDAFVSTIRTPDQREAFRDTASQWISGDRLDALTAIINLTPYITDDGTIDADKVERQLRAMFDDIPPNPPSHQNFGQHTPPPPAAGLGQRGIAAAQARFDGYVTNGWLSTHHEVTRRLAAQKPEEN